MQREHFHFRLLLQFSILIEFCAFFVWYFTYLKQINEKNEKRKYEIILFISQWDIEIHMCTMHTFSNIIFIDYSSIYWVLWNIDGRRKKNGNFMVCLSLCCVLGTMCGISFVENQNWVVIDFPTRKKHILLRVAIQILSKLEFCDKNWTMKYAYNK